jgi:hypothetical protein
MAQSVSMSTAGTAAMALNPVAKSTTLLLSATVASTGFIQIDVTLDDPTIPGGPSQTWATVSSAAAMTSSTVLAAPLIYTVLTPIAGARLFSSALNPTGVFTLKALQSVTA